MRLSLDPRASRLRGRVSRGTVYSGMELLLLSLLAVQCARLAWTAVTPVGSVGDWQAPAALRPPPAAAGNVLASIDPFFRLSDGATAVVTALNLKLFGVRQDRASGRGSAIIATPDGQQRSFAVGEEVMPGVSLAVVDFDSVTISREGRSEQIFLDQSSPAIVASPPPPRGGAAPIASAASVAQAGSVTSEIQFQPRLKDGRIAGVAVQPQGSGNAFRAAGFAPGDVILSVNGQRITSAEQVRSIAEGSREGLTLEVDRAGRMVTLRVGGSR